MIIKKKVLLWIFILVPFFYPSCIAGTTLSLLWYKWKIIATIVGCIYIFAHHRKIKDIAPSIWMIFIFYVLQFIATAINGLDTAYDVNTLLMMSVFVFTTSLIIQEHKNSAILFFYNLLSLIVCLNFLSVVFLYGRGLAIDSYRTPIYFWGTKNHVISLVIVFLFLSKYLYSEFYINQLKYYCGLCMAVTSTILMGSSTAITALFIYALFIFCCYVIKKRHNSVNIKVALIIGGMLDIAVVVLRIQEHLATLISSIFGKDSTLTGRTDLWNQAIELIGINPWFGKGNSYALAQYGWLTKQYWNPLTQRLEDTYFVAHNQFLEVMINGGVVCLLTFLGIFWMMSRMTRNIYNNTYKNYIGAAVLAYFIAMITDLVSPYEPLYLFVIVCSYICRCENVNKRERKTL